MISFNSIKVFIKLNTFLCLFSYFEYMILNEEEESSFDIIIFKTLSMVLLKNYLLIDFLQYKSVNKPFLCNNYNREPVEAYYKEFDVFLVSSSLIETLTMIFVKNFIHEKKEDDIISDLLYFIPLSFGYEIIFDLFHYLTHRLCHHRLFYSYHKLHHRHQYPTAILTFYQHPFDVIMTNSIPTILTSYLFSDSLSRFMFVLINTYKTFIEISGHLGKENRGTSFSQFIWLPKFFLSN